MSAAGGEGREPLRVVQFTTGNVGRRSVLAVLANPALELVGCHAWSPDKVGRDVGELCGVDPVGVTATDDVEALLALAPDCAVYNPKFPDVDTLVRLLEAGIDVVSTSVFITGRSWGDDKARIAAACAAGGATMFGTGMNPGFANLLGIVSAGVCDRVDSITVLESVDSTGYDSPDTDRAVGFGRPIDDPGLPAMTEEGTAVFGDAVELMAGALGLELDDIVCVPEYARTTEHLDMGSWSIDADCVAGVAGSWQGIYEGRPVVELKFCWRKGGTLEPDWRVEHGYIVEVAGRPSVHTKLQIFPPEDFEATSFADYMVLGMIMTSLPAINAIPAVVAAPPGIATYLDLPLPTPSGWVPSGG